MRLLPFTQTFSVNPTLGEKLRAEAAGILAWAVRGCILWQRQGLNPPEVVLEATREYEQDSDPLAGFLEEACEPDVDAEIGANELYRHYKAWADQRGLMDRERLTATKFGTKMGERLEHERRRSGKVYKGISGRTL